MNIDMTRHSGAIGIPVAECIDSRFGIWRVRTDIQPVKDEESGQQTGVSFIEIEFPYKPTMKEVKEFVIGVIDKTTDAKILEGYEWTILHGDEEKPDGERRIGETWKVWLSRENQDNFKEAHRLACLDPTKVIPVKFKINETDDKEAVYETFDTFDELNQFYLGAFAYIKQTCLDTGWSEKDSLDWTPYEEALNP